MLQVPQLLHEALTISAVPDVHQFQHWFAGLGSLVIFID